MRMSERLLGLKQWAYEQLCRGREMKAPGPNMDIASITRAEPKCFLGWAPNRMDERGFPIEVPESTVPSVLIMPNQSYAKLVEEKRFDRYGNIHRSQELGQQLGITLLFSVYEPGVRLPGFADSAGAAGEGLAADHMIDGTEQGLIAVYNWMDDCMAKLLGQKIIPGTDLFVQEESVLYSLYTDQNYVSDRRPLYYGFVNAVFSGYANAEFNPQIEELLN